jgi:hypothetical protein
MSEAHLIAALSFLLGVDAEVLSSKEQAELRKVFCNVTFECSADLLQLAEMFRKNGEELQEADRHPVLLALDKDLQCLPWENMPVLLSYPVCRTPSLHFALARTSQLSPSASVDNVV